LDLGAMVAFVEADAPRVTFGATAWWSALCRGRATPRGSHVRLRIRLRGWLSTSQSAVAQLMRVAWRTVGAICERVCDEAKREVDLLAGLRRIGIDEIPHRMGHAI
jgi:hypothetical protein